MNKGILFQGLVLPQKKYIFLSSALTFLSPYMQKPSYSFNWSKSRCPRCLPILKVAKSEFCYNAADIQ